MQVLLYLIAVVLFGAGGVAAYRRGVPAAVALDSFAAATAVLGYTWPALGAL